MKSTFVERLHFRLREATALMNPILLQVPKGARLAEFGCGQGHLLAKLAGTARKLTGVDFDSHKCAMARQLCAAFPQVEVVEGGILGFLESRPAEVFEVIIFSDTLSHNPPESQRQMLALSAQRLAPGGRLLLKFIDTRPRFKALLALGLYFLNYRLAGVSKSVGQQVFYQPAATYQAWLGELGLAVETHPIHRQHHHPLPHVLIVGMKPL